MRHLQTCPPEAALDVEALVCLAAVEDSLVAADLLGDEVECLDQPQTQLLALLVLGYRDVLDVSDEPEVVDAARKSWLAMAQWRGCCSKKHSQLPLDNQCPGAHDLAAVLNHENVVSSILPAEPLESLCKGLFADVADGGEDAQAVEESGAVVGLSQTAHFVALGQSSCYFWRDEIFAEEACFWCRGPDWRCCSVCLCLDCLRGRGRRRGLCCVDHFG